MHKIRGLGQPIIGVLPGYEVFEGTIPHGFLTTVFRGIRSAARDYGGNLLLACGVGAPRGANQPRPAWPQPSAESDFVPVGPWNTDGLIVITPLLSKARSDYIQGMMAAGHPVVFLGRGEAGPVVDFDNLMGIRQALAHLIEHGHRRIAFIAGHPEATTNLEAYRAAVQDYGLPAEQNLVVYGYHNQLGGQQAAQQLLDIGVEFTAVLVSDVPSAIGAMQRLQHVGRRVPEDVAVIGFDDQLEAMAQIPPLTAIRYSTFEIGYRTFKLLWEALQGAALEAQEIQVPPRLIVRQSCGCRPGGLLLPGSPVAEIGFVRTPPAQVNEAAAPLKETLAESLATALVAELRELNQAEALALCQNLVEGFVAALAEERPATFHLALSSLLHRLEGVEADIRAWEAVTSALESQLLLLLKLEPSPIVHQKAEALLSQAQAALYDSSRRGYSRYLVHQAHIADEVERITERLHATLDEAQILEAFVEASAMVGIHFVAVAFFEPEKDDPVAWSILRASSDRQTNLHKFRSREFPGLELGGVMEAPFQLCLLPLTIQPGLSGFVAFEAEDLAPCGAIVRQLAVALRSAQLYRLKSLFLSTVSHELRTPLNLIVGLSEILLREQAQPSQPSPAYADLERLHSGVQHLGGLIQDVLDLASSQMGELKLFCESVDLQELLQPVVATGERLARDKGLDWQAQLPEPTPRVWGDRTRLRQVALNLVSNAVKFTEKGKITLEVKRIADFRLLNADLAQPQSSISNQQSTILFRVTDTGLGIPLTEQEVIFDEFRRSERATARGYSGLGLGLAICKRLIELHGGEIGVYSTGEEGAGSTFYFTLPVIEKADLSGPRLPAEPTHTLLLTKRGGDWEQLLEHLAQQSLTVTRVDVEATPDWFSRLLTAPVEVVVLDSNLAAEQGWEILKVLKGHPATERIPVLFYAQAPTGEAASLLELDYLTKPISQSKLTQVLARQGALAEAPEASGETRIILIVDDQPGSLEMYTRMVRSQAPHYQVLTARNGYEALAQMQQTRPDLVLLDLRMPELDGFGVLEAMQQSESTRTIPVIILTAQLLNETDMARLNRGVATILEKGLFSVEETLAHVSTALARNFKLGGEARRLVRKAMAYVHTHYAEPITREKVAGYVGVSESYLTRCFHQETGMAPLTYLNRYRIKRAKDLLEASEHTVTQVALAVGFASETYFMRVFRREVGMSPGVYRRQQRKKQLRGKKP